MASPTILFLDDKTNSSNPTVSVTASSTEQGYSAEAVRDPNYATAWKSVDGTADEYIQFDLGSTTWLGAALNLFFCVIAYDAREADQNQIELRQDVADNPAGAFASLRNTYILDKTVPTPAYSTHIISSPGKRYYRLTQLNSARGGGTRTAKIHGWSMYALSGVYQIDSGYPGQSVGPGAIGLEALVGAAMSPDGFIQTGRKVASVQEVEITFDHTTKQLWQDLRDAIHKLGVSHRPFYAQYEGLKNPAVAHFQMVRIVGSRWSAARARVDNFDVSISVETEAHA